MTTGEWLQKERELKYKFELKPKSGTGDALRSWELLHEHNDGVWIEDISFSFAFCSA
jgi:hypothetical protein